MSEQEITTDVEELKQEWTPKQKENWQNHGKPVYDELSETSQQWYVRLFRPKMRGDGMMERDHVKISTPEHYLKKKIEGLKRPMSSVQGEIMATFGVDKEVMSELDDVATEYVKVTTTDAQKKRIAQQGKRLSDVMGI
jgi:hypothetical protein